MARTFVPNLVVDRRSFLAGAAAAGTLLTGTGTAAAQARAKVKYLTPFGYLIGFAETMYADTGGFFAKEGLDVEIEGGRGSAMSVQQVMGGNVLLSRTGGTDHIKAYAKDPSIVAIGEIFQRNIFYVISHADKPIRSAADLAGKTIGVVSPGGATENLLDMMLTSVGIPAAQTERQSVGNAPSAFELVKLGRVAGYIATSDTVFQLTSDKQPVVAWSTDDAAPCPGQVYMTSRASLDKNGEQLAKFFRAVHASIGAMLQAENNLGPVVELDAHQIRRVRGQAAGQGCAGSEKQPWPYVPGAVSRQARLVAGALDRGLRTDGQGESRDAAGQARLLRRPRTEGRLRLKSELQSVNPQHVVTEKFPPHLRLEAVIGDLLHGAAEIDHRKIGAEDHLVLAPGVDEAHEALRPIARAVRVRADEDIGMLPRHGDHLVVPRNADVDADQLQARGSRRRRRRA